MPATGPTGNRLVIPTRPLDAGMRSSGIVSPTIRSASSAPSRKVSAARSTSTSASRVGLPASSAMSRERSKVREVLMKRVLVTGDRGFTGRHLTEYLRSQGFEVTGLSRSSGGDIREPVAVRSVVQAAQPEVVYHLAAAPRSADSAE